MCSFYLFIRMWAGKDPVQAKEESKDAVKSENDCCDTFKSTAMMVFQRSDPLNELG